MHQKHDNVQLSYLEVSYVFCFLLHSHGVVLPFPDIIYDASLHFFDYWNISGQDRKGHCHFVGYQPLIPSELKLHREQRAAKSSGGPTRIDVDMSDAQHVSGH